MTERSHGKARPSLPRAAELPVPHPPPDRGQGRDARGRFAPGNRQSARSRGWRRAIAQLASGHVATAEQAKLAGDSGSLYRATLSTLPYQGPLTNPIAADNARSAVLSAHLASAALAAGVTTAKGRQLLELSLKLGQRAERTAVTLLDLTTRLAEAERKRNPQPFPWLDAAEDDEDEDERDGAADASGDVATTSASSANENAATRQPDASARVEDGGEGA